MNLHVAACKLFHDSFFVSSWSFCVLYKWKVIRLRGERGEKGNGDINNNEEDEEEEEEEEKEEEVKTVVIAEDDYFGYHHPIIDKLMEGAINGRTTV